MKRISCEMCGSNNVIKQEGLYVCQNCGTKYSVEEARKLMVEGVVDVSGSSVKIDSSDELKNLYTLARRARDEYDIDHQWKYYEMILCKDPDSWEAYLYYRVSRIFNDYSLNTQSVRDSIHTVLGLVWGHAKSEEEATEAVGEIAAYYEAKCLALYNSIGNSLSSQLSSASSMKEKKIYHENYYYDVKAVEDILLFLGDAIKIGFDNVETVHPVIEHVWEAAIEMNVCALPNMRRTDKNQEEDRKVLLQYVDKIKQYNPSYQVPEEKKKGLGALLGKLHG